MFCCCSGSIFFLNPTNVGFCLWPSLQSGSAERLFGDTPLLYLALVLIYGLGLGEGSHSLNPFNSCFHRGEEQSGSSRQRKLVSVTMILIMSRIKTGTRRNRTWGSKDPKQREISISGNKEREINVGLSLLLRLSASPPCSGQEKSLNCTCHTGRETTASY